VGSDFAGETMPFDRATGTITLYDGTTTIGTSSVSKAQAIFSVTTLPVGSHSITAVYSGDDNFDGSSSAVLTLTVR
jgi:hypothetical protein